jgi:hypothetical protein
VQNALSERIADPRENLKNLVLRDAEIRTAGIDVIELTAHVAAANASQT